MAGQRDGAGETEPIAVDRAFWSKDGKAIYFLANLGVHEELFNLDRQLTLDGSR